MVRADEQEYSELRNERIGGNHSFIPKFAVLLAVILRRLLLN